jgi:hemerythrin-like metal-binding protein
MTAQKTSWPVLKRLVLNEVEKQHEHIEMLITELDQNDVARAHADLLLAYLRRYVEAHFAAEERLMARFSYPGSGHHQMEHVEFFERLTTLVTLVTSGEAKPAEVVPIIRTWLQSHLLGPDQHLYDWLVGNVQES